MQVRCCCNGWVAVLVLVLCQIFPLNALAESGENSAAGVTRTYYIAAEEIDWDYAPDGEDMMMTRGFDPYAKVFTAHATDRIGCTYRKAVFREYTDDTFRTLKRGRRGLLTWASSAQ